MELCLSKSCNYCRGSALQLCSRCRIAFYCSPDCQSADFERHRACCREVRAARVKVQDKELDLRYCHPELFPLDTTTGSQRDVFSVFKAKLHVKPPTESYVGAIYEYYQTLVDINDRNGLKAAVEQVLGIKQYCSDDVLKLFQELPYVSLRIGTVAAIRIAYDWVKDGLRVKAATHVVSHPDKEIERGNTDIVRSASHQELEFCTDFNTAICMLLVKGMLVVKLKDATNYWLFLISTIQSNGSATTQLKSVAKVLRRIGTFVEFEQLLRLVGEPTPVSFSSLSKLTTAVEKQLQPLLEHVVGKSSKPFVSNLLWLHAYQKDVETALDSSDLSQTHGYAQEVLQRNNSLCEVLRLAFLRL